MKKTVEVTMVSEVEVEINENLFDEKFLQSFRDSFYNFHTIDDHIKHLARLAVMGAANNFSFDDDGEFIEGYGRVKPLGIKFSVNHEHCEEEIIEDE